MNIESLIPKATMINYIKKFSPKIENFVIETLNAYKTENNAPNAAVFISEVKGEIVLFISDFEFDSETQSAKFTLKNPIKFTDFVEKILAP